jgi:hypothetical protein
MGRGDSKINERGKVWIVVCLCAVTSSLFVFPESIASCKSPNENIGSSMKMPTHSITTASKKCGDGRLHGHLDDIRLAILHISRTFSLALLNQ